MCDVQMNGGNGAGEATESPSHVLRETEPGVEVEQGGRCVTPQKAGRRCLKQNSNLALFPPSARASRPSVLNHTTEEAVLAAMLIPPPRHAARTASCPDARCTTPGCII